LDGEGAERDWDWLMANFGAINLEYAEPPAEGGSVYRVVQLQAVEEPAIQVGRVLDAEGQPLAGVRVVRFWPEAPPLPRWALPASRWRDRGVYGETNDQGEIGFGLGHGDDYRPPAGGASALWVAEEAGPSDLVGGLGKIQGSPHRHLDVVFQRQPAGGEAIAPPVAAPPRPTPPPPTEKEPEPTRDPWQILFEKLDRIAELLEKGQD
jgi:hypothetical protein